MTLDCVPNSWNKSKVRKKNPIRGYSEEQVISVWMMRQTVWREFWTKIVSDAIVHTFIKHCSECDHA